MHHLFESLKQHLRDGRLCSNREEETSLREQLRIREPVDYRNGIVKLTPI